MKKLVFGILAHVDAGKTTLSEAILYRSGAIRKLGRVDNRDAFLDTNALERERKITIFSKQAVFSLPNTEATLLDTPGHVDFSAEMERTLRVLDYAVLVINGADGVQSHTTTLWKLLTRYRIPTFLFVNKMDQPGTSEARLLQELKTKLHHSIVNFTHPDLEDIALCDESLLNTYLETGDIDLHALTPLIAERKAFPCYFGSALRLTGVDELLQGLDTYTKATDYPENFGARVFKITRDETGARLTHLKVTGGTLLPRQVLETGEKVNQLRIYSGHKYTTTNEALPGSIVAVTGLDSTTAGQSFGCDNTGTAPILEPVLRYKLILPTGVDPLTLLPKLRLLEEEDPSLQIGWNPVYGELHVKVMGTVQTEILKRLIADRFGVSVEFGTGSIVYKETIADTVEGVGHFEPLRHYAEVHLLMEPGEPGSGLVISTRASEDKLAKNWQRLILTHLYEKSHVGVLTGSPITDMRITLVSGRAHEKHTEGGDFRQATYRAIRQGLMQATSVLLEPVYEFTLTVPQENVGRTMTDLERLHATFALESSDTVATLVGSVPVAALGDYPAEVMSYTKGQGILSCRLKGYEPCHNTEAVLEALGYDPERDTENPADSVFCAHGAGFTVPWYEVPNYMHLEAFLSSADEADEDGSFSDASHKRGRASRMEELDLAMGTEEIDAILDRTFYANRKSSAPYKKSRPKPLPDAKPYRGQETYQNAGENYLLVDGYNIIFAWKELAELAKVNLDGARGRLLDILCNYQAMKKCTLIAVFDAYRVAGHATETMDYHNIHVVYTKEAETADQYIERFAHTHGSKYYVRVATSDGLEQMIIRGEGCHLVSAREFEEEVKRLEKSITEEYVGKTL